ncbi:rCG54478, partial [Rattus norvegicus]
MTALLTRQVLPVSPQMALQDLWTLGTTTVP